MIRVFHARHTFSMSKLSAEIKRALSFRPCINVVITVGNGLRSDDGVGPYISSKISSSEFLKVIDAGYTPEDIIDEVTELIPKRIIIIDAADFGGASGEIRIIDSAHIPESSLSTHAISLRVITKILSEDTKADIIFIGIQPKSVALGEGLSLSVRASADKIINYLRKEFVNA